MSRGSRRAIIGSTSSDCSTEDLILKDEEMAEPNGLLTTEPYLNVVVNQSAEKKQCTLLNKFLLSVAFMFFISTIVFVGLYMHALNLNKPVQFCTSADCVEASAFMKMAMDETVDPCEDFYKYSCGGWLAKNPIPDGKSKVSVDSILSDSNMNVMREILNNISKYANDSSIVPSKAIRQSVTLFKTCKNIDAVNELKAQPLLDLLERVGVFDTSGQDKVLSKEEKREEMLVLFQKMLTESFLFPYFGVEVYIDDKNSSGHVLKVSQWTKGLGLNSFEYKKNRTDGTTVAYINFLTELGVRLLPKVPRLNISKMAEETYQFEKDVAEIFVPNDKLMTVEQTYHNTTINKLQANMSSSIDYLRFIQHMFSNVTDVKITGDERIIVDTLDFFKKIDSIINKADMRVIQNFVMFSISNAYLEYLSEEYVALSKNLTKARTGETKEVPRWKMCVRQTDSGLGMALGRLFIEKTFAKSSYSEAHNLVDYVREAFIGALHKLSWMDSETARAAEKKALMIKQKIGYPKFIRSNEELDEFYKGLELVENEYFENKRRVFRFRLSSALSRLRKEVDRKIWYMSPPTVNAYYNPSGNQIVFPAGILQPPFFKAGYPKSLNFGSMGAVIGHEITHGFDNNGRLYDAEGNYRGKEDWWTDQSVKQFNKRTKCFIEQYSNFTVAGEKVKGNVTLGENIADNGGLKAAFSAYSNWVKENGEQLLLPGLERTNEEVFFIAFGQTWCTGDLKIRLQKQVETDVHSPDRERVKGSVQNNRDFSRVFKCKSGSTMNPKNKCSIW